MSSNIVQLTNEQAKSNSLWREAFPRLPSSQINNSSLALSGPAAVETEPSPTETTNDTQPKSNAIYSLMWMDFKNSFYSTQVSLADKFVLYWKDDFDRTYQNREDKSKGSRVQCAEIRLVMRTMIQLLGELPCKANAALETYQFYGSLREQGLRIEDLMFEKLGLTSEDLGKKMSPTIHFITSKIKIFKKDLPPLPDGLPASLGIQEGVYNGDLVDESIGGPNIVAQTRRKRNKRIRIDDIAHVPKASDS